MHYFIHGDDFGRSVDRTDAINRLLHEGGIQRTSLIVNLRDTDRAAELAHRGGYERQVCFHLNLSEGLPLTEGVRSSGLCKASGEFRWARSKQILTSCLSRAAIRAIRDEAEAQMLRFRDLGFRSDHMDSHDWLLFNWPVWRAVKPLLADYGFVTTRKACENWIRTKNLPLRSYYLLMEKQVEKGLRMDETWSGGLRSFRRAADRGLISAETRAEIMTHPELVDGKVVDSSNHELISMDELIAEMARLSEPYA